MKLLNGIAGLLVLLGAINWGLVAAFEWDAVAAAWGLGFGETNAGSRIVYALVGFAAVFTVRRLVGAPQTSRAERARSRPVSAPH